VSTKEAYKKIDYSKIGKNIDKTETMKIALKNGNFEKMKKNMHNDFEHIVYLLHPELQSIKNNLLQRGAKAAVMSGSGSTVLGVFDRFEDAESAKAGFEKAFAVSSI
jgi:4-diphosphocytidyl-2-C-methyl-D-erythritol kinase